ncbi:MAG: hypothetical protein WCF36_19200, partial [Candidatus Nanopelagicales bacterium]
MHGLPNMLVEAVADPLGADPAGPAVASRVEALAPGVVIVGVGPGSDPDEPVAVQDVAVDLLALWGVDLPRRLARAHASGKRSAALWIDLEAEEPAAVMILGLGSGTPDDLRRSAAAAVRRVRGTDEVLVLATRGLDESGVRAFTEGLYLGTPPPTWATSAPPAPPGRVRLA